MKTQDMADIEADRRAWDVKQRAVRIAHSTDDVHAIRRLLAEMGTHAAGGMGGHLTTDAERVVNGVAPPGKTLVRSVAAKP